MTLAPTITYRNGCDISGMAVQHWANAHTKRYTPDSVDTERMDYYDHDERERKQMHHSIGPVRIYRKGPDKNDESGGSSGSFNLPS